MKNPFSSLILARRLTQGLVLAVFLYIIWTTRYPLQGFVNPRLFFQIDPLVMFVTALAERLWLPGMWWALGTLGVTFILGRFFCGWGCPLGTLQDWSAALINRFRRPREGEPGAGRWVKYGLLAALAGAGLAGLQVIWFFDPITIFVRAFSFNIHPAVNQGLDRAWAWLLQAAGDPTTLEILYYRVKDRLLDLGNPVFPHAGPVFWIFISILIAVGLQRRFWCRYLCPLGAFLGLAGRGSPFRRETPACRTGCTTCRNLCRTNAIRTDNSYNPGECILCFDCLAGCAQRSATFRFRLPTPRPASQPPERREGTGLTRAQFLLWLSAALALTQGAAGRRAWGAVTTARPKVLRPPGALPEAEFVQRCVRCGNCMKVCLTHVLQPAVWESGAEGVWTPRLAPELGYCEYQCNLCGQVCPTGAIRPLGVEEKKRFRIGLAVIRKDLCKPYATDEECLVCEEHCPIYDKAIKMVDHRDKHGRLVRRPVIVPALCNGCAICVNKCPVRPVRAIEVRPL
jgi:polyferredoxin/ferredoxin